MAMLPPLLELTVLVVDCQATGATPARGHLIELGWCEARAAGGPTAAAAAGIRSHLIRLPAKERIPRQVCRITGIRDTDLDNAPPAASVWEGLRLSAEVVARKNGSDRALAVAHFARFERGFLEALSGGVLPFDLTCTYELACRLLPDIPGRSLRALAGYLGVDTPHQQRRARDHVAATATIWSALVERLSGEGVGTLDALEQWMRDTPPVRRRGKAYRLDRAKRLGLPDAPGVYRLLDASGNVLYVGKASSLKRRVNSYFQRRRRGSGRRGAQLVPELVSRVWDVDVAVTCSALEAALCEGDEIKRHAPPYNRALRGSDRGIWFLDSSLRDATATPDRAHRIGPVPSTDPFVATALLADLLDGADSRRIGGRQLLRCLGLRGPPPTDTVVSEARRLFLRAHGHFAPGRPSWLRLSARLWRALADATDPPEGDASDEHAPDVPITAERLLEAFERLVVVSGQLFRRARWLCALSESVLCWRPAGQDDDRSLVFEGGRLLVDAGEPRWARTTATRQEGFSLASYDRLRVLTTELRRIVAEERLRYVALGPRRKLDGRAMKRRLRWL